MKKTSIISSQLLMVFTLIMISFVSMSTMLNNNNLLDSQMIFVEGGTFMMGCSSEQGNDCVNDEKPTVSVKLYNYYIGKYEITNIQYCKFLNEQGNQEKGGKKWYKLDKFSLIVQVDGNYKPRIGFDNYPVSNVSWYGANAYAIWLSNSSGKKFRLPTEAEWEFAARGGIRSKNYKYSGSNILEEVGWYGQNCDNSRTGWGFDNDVGLHPVGQKMENELGIYDMSGNVNEWCSDLYDLEYAGGTNPQGSLNGSEYVIRGGSWDSFPTQNRVTSRNFDRPNSNWAAPDGFRLVLDE